MSGKLAEPCKACPWLTSNQGKPHPDGWYKKSNLRRLWAGMRRGEGMSCHPTDTRNPVSDAAKAKGYREAPEHAETKQCVGAVIMQQREVMVAQELYGADFTKYRAARPRGLTKAGFSSTIAQLIFGGTVFGEGREALKPNLNAEVSVDGLDWPLAHRSSDA